MNDNYNSKQQSDKTMIKRIIDTVTHTSLASVEASLTRGEYYARTGLCELSITQLDDIASQIHVLSVAVDGYDIMLNVRI